MRSEKEIIKKLNELCKKKFKERKREYLKECHLNCVYNTRHRLKGMGLVGFCHNPKVVKKNAPYVCSCEETVNECPHFECKHTEKSVKEDFDKIIKDPARAGKEYPKIAVLLWCLQDMKGTLEESDMEIFDNIDIHVQNELKNFDDKILSNTIIGEIITGLDETE